MDNVQPTDNPQTLKPSASSDPHHFPKTALIGLGAFLIIIIGGGIGYYLGVNNQVNPTQNINQLTYPSPTPTPLEIPTVDPSVTANWKTYTNTKYGYLMQYPDGWFVSGISAGGGAIIIPCSESNTDTSIVEFSKVRLKDCGFVGEQLPSSDAELTIWVLDKPWQKEEILITDATGKDISQGIVVAGEKATKTPFTEKSELPNTQATRIYFNHNSKGYLMFLKQTDRKGNYDPAFDQILSTFKFAD